MKDAAANRPSPPLFTLRLWREPLDAQRSEWRGEIKNLHTGEMRYFRRWDEIATLVQKMCSQGSED